jgi:hypothetical protein
MIVEGRARALALVKLCHGESSLELTKCLADLAGAYALQGIWPKVEERVARAAELAAQQSRYTQSALSLAKRGRALAAARALHGLFAALRGHTIRHGGRVRQSFIAELVAHLHSPPEAVAVAVGVELEAVTKLASSLFRFFKGPLALAKQPEYDISSIYHYANASHPSLLDLSAPPAKAGSGGGLQLITEERSWGEMVNFLRTECVEVAEWRRDLDQYLLPQSKAALHLPFHICDSQRRGIAHPTQLANSLIEYPATYKLLAGTKLSKRLNQLKFAVPITINIPISSSENRGQEGSI